MREARTPVGYRVMLFASAVAAIITVAAVAVAFFVTRADGSGIAYFASRSAQIARRD